MDARTAIHRLRQHESIEPIYVLRDPKACAVLLAWKYIDRSAPEGEGFDPVDWQGLWSGVDIDFNSLSRMADVSEGQCRLIIERLQAFRLIYPDGTITEPAEKYLRATTQHHLNELKK